MRHTKAITTLAFLFATAVPVLAAQQDGEAPRSQSKFESYGQISQHGFDRAEFGKTLNLALSVSDDNRTMDIRVTQRDLSQSAFILVGASKIELELPWGDSLLVGDIVMVLELPAGAQSLSIDIGGIELQACEELHFYFQAFTMNEAGAFPPMLTSQGVEWTLSDADADDDGCDVYLPLRAERHDGDIAVEVEEDPKIVEEDPMIVEGDPKIVEDEDGSADDVANADGTVSIADAATDTN